MAFTEKDMQMAAEIAYLVDDKTYKAVAASDPPPTMRKIVEAMRLPDGKFPGKDAAQDFCQQILDPDSKAGDWVLKDVCDHNDSSGMFACTIETAPGQAIVSFRGSEGLFTDWDQFAKDWVVSDGGLINNPLTYQQREAEEYMRYVDEKYHYDEYYTAGHSLGGNLSTHATISASDDLQKRIVENYSFDSPGFSMEYQALHSYGIKNSEGKLRHYTYSAVGDILEQPSGTIEKRIKRESGDAFPANGHNLEHIEFDNNGNTIEARMDGTDYANKILAKSLTAADILPGSFLDIFTLLHSQEFIAEYVRSGRLPGGIMPDGYVIEQTTTSHSESTSSTEGVSGKAMAVTLRVDPDRLIAAAQQFESYNGSLGDLTAQMAGLIESFQGTEIWQGEARTAYTGKLSTLAGNMTKARKKISDFMNDLNKIAANYKKAESTNVSSSAPLGIDYIH